MPARNRVVVEAHEGYAKWGKSFEHEVERRVLEVMGAVAVKAAVEAETREASGDLKAGIHVLPPEHEGDKLTLGIGARDWKSNWYELGTLGRRSKAAKGAHSTMRGRAREARRKAEKGQSGVKALHYMRKGLTAARALTFHEIAEAMRKAKSGVH